MILPIYSFGFFWRNLYLNNSFNFTKDIFLEKINMDELYKFLKEDTSFNMIMIQNIKQLVFTKIIMKQNIDIDKISLELNDCLDLLNLSNLKNKSFYLKRLMNQKN